MKTFLIKAHIFLAINFIIISASIVILHSKTLNFVSNSVSFNAKAQFILNNITKYNTAKIVVIGSSLSLNNLNAQAIQDSLKANTINVASWGTSISNFKDFDIWDGRTVVDCISFSDFHDEKIAKKDGYPFTTNRGVEFLNILTNYKTYVFNCYDEKVAKKDSIFNYSSLNFDACGSALLSPYGFKINARRWDEDTYALLNVDSAKVLDFVNEVTGLIHKTANASKLVICFLPCRTKFYTVEKEAIAEKLGLAMKAKCPQVRFINMFNMPMADSCFVDPFHCNRLGADIITAHFISNTKDLHF